MCLRCLWIDQAHARTTVAEIKGPAGKEFNRDDGAPTRKCLTL